jgi:hypothetical protein
MQLLRLLFLASVQVWVSNAQAVVSVCQIMDITPNSINGLVQCGSGSLTFGCVCCGGPQGDVGCLSPIETCTMGVLDYYCVKSPGYTTTSCASEGLANCGTVCMPIGGSCCPSGIQYCPAGFSCDSQNMCVENSQVPTPTTKSTTAYASTKLDYHERKPSHGIKQWESSGDNHSSYINDWVRGRIRDCEFC